MEMGAVSHQNSSLLGKHHRLSIDLVVVEIDTLFRV